MLFFIKTDSTQTDFQKLVKLLDQDLSIRDGDEHDFYAQFNKIDAIKNVIVCYSGEVPVGCGAFKPYDDFSVEIKRMFVDPAYRGKGIGLHILNELEQWAAASKYTACVLETGKKQPEAIQLYTKAGYKIIQNYGQYENIENSVCMKKTISDTTSK